MITYQVIQTSIEELKAITKVDFMVMDLSGFVAASTMDDEIMDGKALESFAASPADSQVIKGNHLFKIRDQGEICFILITRGIDDNAFMMGKIAVSQIQNLLIAYKEKYDRNSFYQNLLLDNLLFVDIYNRAKKLHIPTKMKRAVFIIETKKEQGDKGMEMMKSLFGVQSNDFITAVDEKNMILIKSLDEKEGYGELDHTAKMLVDVMNTEIMAKVRVSYGTIVTDIREISRSYKEAAMALDVGKIFYVDKDILPYNMLGIGRLIYQLSPQLCEMFMQEIFGKHIPEDLDEELLTTVNKFFENNLNVSETSRQLYIHRNTLVYRIEKLEKYTGLDIRLFEDALTLKIALMVVNYMNYMKKNSSSEIHN